MSVLLIGMTVFINSCSRAGHKYRAVYYYQTGSDMACSVYRLFNRNKYALEPLYPV